MAHDVFVSYSVEDKTIADAVCATLETNRIRCWIAPRDVLAGQDYAEALIDAIYDSRMMVLVFSASSNDSPQVIREVERAVNKGIPIIPFRIEDVPLSRSMEYFLSRTHWLDALTPPLEKHLQHLAETVSLLLSREQPHVGPPHERRYRPTLLLNAYETAKRWAGRPIVRLAPVFGALVGAVVAAAIFAPLGLPWSDGSSSGVPPSTPDARTPSVLGSSTPPLPDLGTYSGTTSQGRPIEFDVVDESRAIGRIELNVEGIGPGYGCEFQNPPLRSPVPIVDNAFSYSAIDFDISGTFDSATTASGSLNVHSLVCSAGPVTWTASAR